MCISLSVRRMLLAACLVTCAVATGCGGSSNDESASPRPRNSPTTTEHASTTIDQKAAAERQAKADITRRYHEWYEISRTLKETNNNWQDPRIAEYLEGKALETVQEELKERHFKGELNRRPNDSPAKGFVKSVLVKGDEAEVTYCEVNDAIVVSKDGVVLNDEVGTYVGVTHWIRSSGVWKLESGIRRDLLNGVHPCGE